MSTSLPADDAAPARKRALVEAVIAALGVTGAVTLASALVPREHSGTVVGLAFLAAVWWLVWRRSDERVEASGLSFAGLVVSRSIDRRRVARDSSTSLAWSFGLAALTFVPFFFGWRVYWKPVAAFSLVLHPVETANLVLGQLMLVALPEEAFYRGYLQTRLDEAMPPRWRVLGATVGPGLLVASAVFAVGHLLTVHSLARLAVFFPSLLFGWLRARTGGVGAGILFHVLCNVFSELLGRGYGLY